MLGNPGRVACDEAVRKVLKEAMEAEGRPEPRRFRRATDDDQWLVHQPFVSVLLPGTVQSVKVLWGISGDLWVESDAKALEGCVKGIRESQPRKKKVKGSPKKKRKKRASDFSRSFRSYAVGRL